jgi:hypothetical protein
MPEFLVLFDGVAKFCFGNEGLVSKGDEFQLKELWDLFHIGDISAFWVRELHLVLSSDSDEAIILKSRKGNSYDIFEQVGVLLIHGNDFECLVDVDFDDVCETAENLGEDCFVELHFAEVSGSWRLVLYAIRFRDGLAEVDKLLHDFKQLVSDDDSTFLEFNLCLGDCCLHPRHLLD